MTNKLSFPAVLLLLVAIAAAVPLAGCASEPPPEPAATPDIPATVSAAVALALGTPVPPPDAVSPESRPAPTDAPYFNREPAGTPDMEATINAAVAVALGTPVARPVGARTGYCGRLCDGDDYWSTASLSDVQAELNQGADVNATDNNGLTPLHIAAFYGYVDVVALLLNSGADANARDDHGYASLYYAIIRSRPDAKVIVRDTIARHKPSPQVVDLLLQHGTDVNGEVNERYPRQQTYLLLELSHGDRASPGVVKLLLNHGADTDFLDAQDRTLLHVASATSPSVISLILDSGEDVMAVDNEGNTPLHYAATSDDPRIIELLLSNGARSTARNADAKTACELAHQNHFYCQYSNYRHINYCQAGEYIRTRIRDLLCQ